jgi:hypothetical protein
MYPVKPQMFQAHVIGPGTSSWGVRQSAWRAAGSPDFGAQATDRNQAAGAGASDCGHVVRSPMTEAITPSLVTFRQQDIRIDGAAAQAALALHETTPEPMIAAVVRHERTMKEPALL